MPDKQSDKMRALSRRKRRPRRSLGPLLCATVLAVALIAISAAGGAARTQAQPGPVGGSTAVTPGAAARAFAVLKQTAAARASQTTKKRIWGRVRARNGKPVAGAKVRVVLDAADSRYSSSGKNLVGSAKTSSTGRYRVATGKLPRGSIVDVVVTRKGYTSVFVYGTYRKRAVEVDFVNFGSKGGDRRMPVGEGQIPPLPFQGLLPGDRGA